MKRENKELTAIKSVSLPLRQIVRISEWADANGTDFSSATSKLIKLGFVYQEVLAHQEADELDRLKNAVVANDSKVGVI